MQTVTMYEAKDGKPFRDEAPCLEYEQQCDDSAAATDMLANGATPMAALTRANQTRPCWDTGLSVEDKVILMNATKDTGFVIRHWQCSDKHRYKARCIDNCGRMLLFGDAEGGFRGGYGNWVTLQDLVHYAHQTAVKHAATKDRR